MITTTRWKLSFKKRRLKFQKRKFLSKQVYNRIYLVVSQHPRIYGLPKIHKPNTPFGPILPIVGSAQHELADWLVEILCPVLKFYSDYCIPDSFQFASHIHKLQSSVDIEYLVTFDISCLFTIVPLDETTDICANYLYWGYLKLPSFPEKVFVKLMEMATKCVSFSFNIMYQQINVILMVTPLGPLMINIFICFQEKQLFDKVPKLYCYAHCWWYLCVLHIT